MKATIKEKELTAMEDILFADLTKTETKKAMGLISNFWHRAVNKKFKNEKNKKGKHRC